MLEVIDLAKKFNDTNAIDGINFRVKPGEIFGLLGPNGAGKTTTIRIMMNIMRADRGEVLFKDKPRHKVKRQFFGYLPEERGLYQNATVLNMLIYFGRLNNMSRRRAEVESIRYLDKFDLVNYTDHRVNQLSKGMQQKIQFIAASLHNPEVLILDEPFAGLDPVNQIMLRNIFQQYREQGKIIVLSTHQMEEVERLSDHICLLNQGHVILDGRIRDIKKRFREDAYFIEADDDLSFLREMNSVQILEEQNQSCKIALKNNRDLQSVVKIIFEKANIKKFIQVEPSLHDIFVKLIQKDHA